MELLRSLTKYGAVLGAFFLLCACSESQFGGAGQKAKVGKSSKSSGDGESDEKGADSEESLKESPGGSGVDSANKTETTQSDNGQVQETFRGSEKTSSVVAVDIIFAVDTSGSMREEKAAIESNMANFMSRFELDASALDYQIFMIGDDFRFPSSSGRIKHIFKEVGSHDALDVLADFIGSSGASGLRREALKQIVVVTDDNAEGLDAGGFSSFISSNELMSGKTKFNGFIGLPNSQQNNACELESVGAEYIELGQDPQLGGLMQDLCAQDWGLLMTNLAASIITQSSTRPQFKLGSPADTNKKITIEVDGVELQAPAVRYDEAAQLIIFAAGSEPSVDAVVTVTYTPAA